MSFIYAISDEVNFVIMSDTKVTINDNLLQLWKDKESKKIVEQFGMVKCVILTPNIAVAFAGNNVEKAALLLRRAKEFDLGLEELVKVAYEIHRNSNDDEIEFIIGYYEDQNKKELISIKNREITRRCNRAWLGSYDAYNEFKRQEKGIEEINYKNLYAAVLGEDKKVYQEKIDERLAYCWEQEKIFEKVVDSGVDSAVGGGVVKIKIPQDDSHFEYFGSFYSRAGSEPQKVEPGESIQFFQGVGIGSFTCKIYQSSSDFCLYIYEDSLGVIYSDSISYIDGCEGLKFPILYKEIEEDKFDKFVGNLGAYSCVRLG